MNVTKIYKIFLKHYGRQNWWPGDSKFEIVLGAILTQNVSWNNVEKVIVNLKNNNLLDPYKIAKIDAQKLSLLIKPAGFYNQKTRTIKNFLNWFSKFNYDFDRVEKLDTNTIRNELLNIKGIGFETADSILLYALNKKIFVIDAYTKRIFSRIGLINENYSYTEIQKYFHKNFKTDLQDYNEYHALIVYHGKTICKKKPHCDKCCISKYCKKIFEN